jgi:hypothetical protein
MVPADRVVHQIDRPVETRTTQQLRRRSAVTVDVKIVDPRGVGPVLAPGRLRGITE